MVNPPGNHQEPIQASSSAFNGNGILAPEITSTALAMKHNPGISMEWTAAEQAVLDRGLSEFASESNIIRYAKIAIQLKNKTVRDVALRVRWMTKKESSKRRKEENSLSRKSKEKKERATENPSQPIAHPNFPSYASPVLPMDHDDGISNKAIGGPTGELLEQNAQSLNQISANLAVFQVKFLCNSMKTYACV
ncbi:hypothetical protein SAY86_019246 [Trapa natans]|uniref:Myb-like domain-containing protein n=1 Tax=Trapa natans TaxID=22666 RepID=A0AAN7R3X8_TRANT|nr:hypothetical protein SAY86_019246 [Trapa natans]